jgi:hypothetical protein
MFKTIGFGWVILAVFLFVNLMWGWDTAINPPPRTMRRKPGPRQTKPRLKKMAKHSSLPIVRIQRPPINEPVSQPVR